MKRISSQIIVIVLVFILIGCSGASRAYDSFNNSKYDGSYNHSRWVINQEENGSFEQRDGIMIIKTNGKANSGISLRTIDYSSLLDKPISFEAKLMVSNPQGGHVFMYLEGMDGINGVMGTDCTLGYGAQAKCNFGMYGTNDYTTEESDVTLATWHTFRIEVYPDNMEFKYYLDNKLIGSHIPENPAPLREAVFHLEIGFHQSFDDGRNFTGYIDDVMIGHPK
jgi:hypothetical protein